MWRNTESRYGLATKLLHWSVATLILGLVWLGWYMVGLTYYDAWYNDSLAWHKALGIVAFVLGAVKIAWTVHSRPPAYAGSLKPWERAAATAVHHLFYVMMVLIPLTGYLVSTSEGEGVDLWGWFTVPAVAVAGEEAPGPRDRCALLVRLRDAGDRGGACRRRDQAPVPGSERHVAADAVVSRGNAPGPVPGGAGWNRPRRDRKTSVWERAGAGPRRGGREPAAPAHRPGRA